MLQLFLAAAVLAALVAVGLRAWRRLGERARPGRSPRTALPVNQFGDIDMVVAAERCPCGSRFSLRGEGPLRGRDSSIRMARLECPRCARERVLYFDLREIVH